MQIIPLQAVPSQSFTVALNGQSCQIDLQQTNYGLFMNFWLNNPSAPTVAGILCQDRNKLIRNSYFGFSGDLAFVDQLTSSDPYYTGLGTQFLLYYLEPSDLSGTA